MKEEWREVVGYEGWYSVSEHGRVRRDKAGQGCIKGRIIKPCNDSSGHLILNLYKNGMHRSYNVHNIVSSAFIGKKPKGFTANHKDGNKVNNHFSNLEYITKGDNTKHAWRIGLIESLKGEDHPKAILTNNKVLEIREKHILGEKIKNLVKKYGVSRGAINCIIFNRSWKHI